MEYYDKKFAEKVGKELARIAREESRPTKGAVDAALPSCPMCGSTDPEHFHVKRTWLNPDAPLT